jgi:hypothetical protein
MVTERTRGRRPRRQTRSPASFGLEVTRGDSRRLGVTSRTTDDDQIRRRTPSPRRRLVNREPSAGLGVSLQKRPPMSSCGTTIVSRRRWATFCSSPSPEASAGGSAARVPQAARSRRKRASAGRRILTRPFSAGRLLVCTPAQRASSSVACSRRGGQPAGVRASSARRRASFRSSRATQQWLPANGTTTRSEAMRIAAGTDLVAPTKAAIAASGTIPAAIGTARRSQLADARAVAGRAGSQESAKRSERRPRRGVAFSHSRSAFAGTLSMTPCSVPGS